MDTFEAYLMVCLPMLELLLFGLLGAFGAHLLGKGTENWFEGTRLQAVILVLCGSIVVYLAAVIFMTLLMSTWGGVWPNYLTIFVQTTPILVQSAIVSSIAIGVVLASDIRIERYVRKS